MGATRKPKIPTALKVDIYANVISASDDIVIAGTSSGANLAAWSPDRGAFVIDQPHLEGVPYRAAPEGIAVLPERRFIMTWLSFTTHNHKKFTSAAGVFGINGNAIGTTVSIAGQELGACATSPAGDLVAIASKGDKGRVFIWTVDELAAGRKPVHAVDAPRVSALAFTQDGESVIFLVDQTMHCLSARGGAVIRKPVKVMLSASLISTSSTGLVCVSNGSSAAVVTLDGKEVWHVPTPSSQPSTNFVEHAVITRDGSAVIAAAGELTKHFQKAYVTGVSFPAPGMEKGHVSVYDANGTFRTHVLRAKHKPVRALAVGPVVAIGQDDLAELVAWPFNGSEDPVKADGPKRTPHPKPGSSSVEELIATIEAKAKAAGIKLATGATEKEIAETEKVLGQPLPDEVKAFYRQHNGAESDVAVAARELLSLKRMASEWKIWKQLLDDGTFESNDHGMPGPGVQNKWWIPEWIPLTYDGAGNHHVLDLAPAPGGRRGQILSFWHDDAVREVVGPSLLAWLANEEWGDPDAVEDEVEPAEAGGGFRRFEMEEKFWAIRLHGNAFTVRFGKLGTDGQEKTKEFPDAASARKEYDKLVGEKTRKGYQEV